MTVIHPLPPVFDENSHTILLGTMPSPASRAAGFYYMHKQNRFWQVMSRVTGDTLRYKNNGERAGTTTDLAAAIAERKALVLRHGLALWDVLASCDINGAADSSIKNALPNDIGSLLRNTKIRRIFTTGQAAHKLYTTLVEPETQISAVCLPSTSAANAKWTLDMLAQKYAEHLSLQLSKN